MKTMEVKDLLDLGELADLADPSHVVLNQGQYIFHGFPFFGNGFTVLANELHAAPIAADALIESEIMSIISRYVEG